MKTTFSWRLAPVLLLALLFSVAAHAAMWQYSVPAGKGTANMWIPPQTQTLRGFFVIGQLGIEAELLRSAEVRQALADNDMGIVYFTPHINGTFMFWKDATITPSFLKAFDDLAAASGHPEVARVPWITAGHSTAGIYCRNVAYWQPERTAGVVSIKSGDYLEKGSMPPAEYSLAGVPLVSINGQFETYGPSTIPAELKEGNFDKTLGRETQWLYAQRMLQTWRTQNPQYLMAEIPHPGGDHFFGSPELASFVATFIRKSAQYRIPKLIPAGTDPVKCLTVKAEDGWLIDPDYRNPKIAGAAYNDYAGDKGQAMWFYDKEMAEAAQKWMHNLGNPQALQWSKEVKFIDEGDGMSFTTATDFSKTMSTSIGAALGGKEVGHATTPIVYRTIPGHGLEQTGPNTFHFLRVPGGRGKKTYTVIFYNPGDDKFAETTTWNDVEFPTVKGEKQTITFQAIADLKADAFPYTLNATATSGLPVHYEADFGPIDVVDGKLVLSEIPTNAQYPFECKVSAYQVGSRFGKLYTPAAPVSVTFKVVK
ncbi:MAG: hypothetical protein WCJ56_14255 [bacterium]